MCYYESLHFLEEFLRKLDVLWNPATFQVSTVWRGVSNTGSHWVFEGLCNCFQGDFILPLLIAPFFHTLWNNLYHFIRLRSFSFLAMHGPNFNLWDSAALHMTEQLSTHMPLGKLKTKIFLRRYTDQKQWKYIFFFFLKTRISMSKKNQFSTCRRIPGL